MTAPKTLVYYADSSAANRKVQVLAAAGPKDGEWVNNLTVAICWGESTAKVAISFSCTYCLTDILAHFVNKDSSPAM